MDAVLVFWSWVISSPKALIANVANMYVEVQ